MAIKLKQQILVSVNDVSNTSAALAPILIANAHNLNELAHVMVLQHQSAAFRYNVKLCGSINRTNSKNVHKLLRGREVLLNTIGSFFRNHNPGFAGWYFIFCIIK